MMMALVIGSRVYTWLILILLSRFDEDEHMGYPYISDGLLPFMWPRLVFSCYYGSMLWKKVPWSHALT
jgi:hypothetical protein